MSRSPPDHIVNDSLREYQASWAALRRLMLEGQSWSGNERNCVFLNSADQRFGNISAVSGLDFADDGRSLALFDWDHDGDVDVWLRNRTAPQLRLMRNQTTASSRYVAFRLRGRSCNRDAVGSRVEVHLAGKPGRKLVQTLHAGDAFVSQSSKWLHFGVGDAEKIEQVVVRWPAANVETIHDVAVGHHYEIVQNQGEAVVWKPPSRTISLEPSQQTPAKPTIGRLLLSKRFPVPMLDYRRLGSDSDSLVAPPPNVPAEDTGDAPQSSALSKPKLVTFWASWCAPCLVELKQFADQWDALQEAGIDVLALNVDGASKGQQQVSLSAFEQVAGQLELPFVVGSTSSETLQKARLLMDTVFLRRVPLSVPSSLLLDGQGRLAAVYTGRVDVKQLLQDAKLLNAPVDVLRRHCVPLAGRCYSQPWGVSLQDIALAFHIQFPQDAVNYYRLAAHERDQQPIPQERIARQRWEESQFALHMGLAFLLKQTEQHSEALVHARRARTIRRSDLGTLQLLVELLQALGNTDELIATYRAVLEIDPRQVDTQLALAELLEESGQLVDASSVARAVHQSHADLPRANVLLGRLLAKAGQHAEAKPLLEKALEAYPDDTSIRANLGVVCEQQDLLEEAAEHFLKVTQSTPNDARAHYKLGILYKRLSRFALATEQLRRAAQLQPKEWRYQFAVADILDDDGQESIAASHYLKTLELKPDFYLAANNLAWIRSTHSHAQLRNGKEAIKLAKQALRVAPKESAYLLDTLAAAYAEAGNFEQAVASARKALSLAESTNQSALAQEIRARAAQYEQSEPYRESAENSSEQPLGQHQPAGIPSKTVLQKLGLADYLPEPLEAKHGFAGSESCRSCHADEHDSWHHSFHRTMTQPATPDTVVAPFENVTLRAEGQQFHLDRQGDEFWIDMVDPDWQRQQIATRTGKHRTDANPPRVKRRVAMTTGSHHKQTYWVPSSRGRILLRFPWTYRIDDERWIPATHDFLVPPNQTSLDSFAFSFWDRTCIKCHAVGGQPRYTPRQEIDSHVAELGISCEACHGPAAEHVRLHRQVQDGIANVTSQGLAASIVNPRELSNQRSSQICGQCHSFFQPRDADQAMKHGSSFRAGDDLHESCQIVTYADGEKIPFVKMMLKRNPHYLDYSFWKDGTIRVTGRDYNGLLLSPCYQRGELSCLSCHSMHEYQDRNDQLATDMAGNQACLQCHSSIGDNLQQHTHHLPDSSGSLCYNCHMPHTTYGLFKAVRSHRIDSPNVLNSVQTGRPNACNLCHLDKTQQWSAQHLTSWYGHPSVTLGNDDKQIAASLLWYLKGDAAQRAIVAWHMGWQPAHETSGAEWLAPFLAYGLADSYAAVRNVSQRSLRNLPGFARLEYDFLAPPEQRLLSTREIIRTWSQRTSRRQQAGSHLLIDAPRKLRRATVERLLSEQDKTPLHIGE